MLALNAILIYSGVFCSNLQDTRDIALMYFLKDETAAVEIANRKIEDHVCGRPPGLLKAYITYRGEVVDGKQGRMQIIGIADYPLQPPVLFTLMRVEDAGKPLVPLRK